MDLSNMSTAQFVEGMIRHINKGENYRIAVQRQKGDAGGPTTTFCAISTYAPIQTFCIKCDDEAAGMSSLLQLINHGGKIHIPKTHAHVSTTDRHEGENL